MEELKTHPFFSSVNFDQLYRRELVPPFRPTVHGTNDTSNFDEEFTSEPVVDSVVPASALADARNTKFEGFTFVPQSKLK